MKKLFTLVLALVMVFAIAAPAMAAWNAPDATVGSPFGVNVTAVQANTDSYGNKYYTAYPANGAVVAGTPILVMVEFSLPSYAKMVAQYGNPAAALGAFYTYIDLTNLANVDIVDGSATKQVGTAAAGAFPTLDLNTTTGVFNIAKPVSGDLATVYTVILSGNVVKTAAAKFEAFIGYTAAESFATDTSIALDANFSFELGDSDVLFTYTKGTTTHTLDLTFDPANYNKVSTWVINGHRVLSNTMFYDSATPEVVEAGHADYAGLVAALKLFTDKLGFAFGDAIYFTQANIAANFGYSNEVSDFVEYKPYTSSLTVSDGANVPNTGDSVSVIGFVMVALALIATAAVVVKKVRA